jgi:hypothetical protein
LAARDPAERRVGDTVFNFPVLDVSLTGMRLAGVAPATLGTDVMVAIAGLSVPGKVARLGSQEFAVHFECSELVRSNMIKHIYSGRYNAQVDRIRPARVFAAIISRISR